MGSRQPEGSGRCFGIWSVASQALAIRKHQDTSETEKGTGRNAHSTGSFPTSFPMEFFFFHKRLTKEHQYSFTHKHTQ